MLEKTEAKALNIDINFQIADTSMIYTAVKHFHKTKKQT